MHVHISEVKTCKATIIGLENNLYARVLHITAKDARHFDLPCNDPDHLKPALLSQAIPRNAGSLAADLFSSLKHNLLFSNDDGPSQNNSFGAFVPFQAVHFQGKQNIVHNKRASRAVLKLFFWLTIVLFLHFQDKLLSLSLSNIGSTLPMLLFAASTITLFAFNHQANKIQWKQQREACKDQYQYWDVSICNMERCIFPEVLQKKKKKS